MADWHTRYQAGDLHEQRVIRELERRGWTTHRCGQGTYPTTIQQALRRTESSLRRFPDLIAARDASIVTIDAKTRLPSTHTNRYAVSRACLTAGMQFLGMNTPVPLFYVFGDLGVLTPVEIMHYAAIGHQPPSGSYYLVSTRLAHPFDEIFGLPAASMTA
ncbi:hypothetical protein [Streptosporangium sandarakinum]|uniref:hypothetical protein n=1 Tax=Streptosporangium sandarakinum TaxID=1260955 RepID=UPI00378F4818